MFSKYAFASRATLPMSYFGGNDAKIHRGRSAILPRSKRGKCIKQSTGYFPASNLYCKHPQTPCRNNTELQPQKQANICIGVIRCSVHGMFHIKAFFSCLGFMRRCQRYNMKRQQPFFSLQLEPFPTARSSGGEPPRHELMGLCFFPC